METILLYLETDPLDNHSFHNYSVRIYLGLKGFNSNVIDIHKSFVVYHLKNKYELAYFKKVVHEYEERENVHFPITYTKYDKNGEKIT